MLSVLLDTTLRVVQHATTLQNVYVKLGGCLRILLG